MFLPLDSFNVNVQKRRNAQTLVSISRLGVTFEINFLTDNSFSEKLNQPFFLKFNIGSGVFFVTGALGHLYVAYSKFYGLWLGARLQCGRRAPATAEAEEGRRRRRPRSETRARPRAAAMSQDGAADASKGRDASPGSGDDAAELGEVKDKPREKSKVIRVLTVLAYVLSVSLAAIMLSLYYVFLWDPKMPSGGSAAMGRLHVDDEGLAEALQADGDQLLDFNASGIPGEIRRCSSEVYVP
ncbi:Uncharacterized protein GBIM_10233 [Gryllus bimaculatus]|nr:Uncharacterized protein GBIM_10233 [Gryllus bimaculatus]